LLKDEFVKNYEQWGTTKYYFQDDTVNESLEKVHALADIAQSLPFKLEWTGYNRLDLIWSRPETIELLKVSGLRSAYFGIESFNPTAAMAVGKGWNGKKGKDFLLQLKEQWGEDITWYLSFIIGLPGDTYETIEETQKWNIDNGMYEWGYFPLYINRNEGKLWKSEFDVDYAKYGYSFDSDHAFNWKNEYWTRSSARIFSDDLRSRSEPHCKPAAWLLAELTGLGYNYNDIMHVSKKDLDWPSFRIRTREIVNAYVDYQLR
jgi:hypothetical protein